METRFYANGEIRDTEKVKDVAVPLLLEGELAPYFMEKGFEERMVAGRHAVIHEDLIAFVVHVLIEKTHGVALALRLEAKLHHGCHFLVREEMFAAVYDHVVGLAVRRLLNFYRYLLYVLPDPRSRSGLLVRLLLALVQFLHFGVQFVDPFVVQEHVRLTD